MNKRLVIIVLLGFSSGLPLALITSTLQAWFADSGMSVLATGLLSLIGLPYLYRMAWGPLLDRYALCSLGRRRSWMLVTQIGLLLGFIAMSWLSPKHSPKIIAFLAFILAFFSATQDAAIDAHRTEYLPLKQHALGASLAVLAYRLALLLAGGFALIIASHFGWAVTYRLMGFMMLVGIIATLCSSEPDSPRVYHPKFTVAFLEPFHELASRPNIIALISFIVLYKLGEAFTTTTSGIVMPFLIQGLGFSLDVIAYVNKMLGIASILCGGLVAGFLLLRWPLYRSLMVFGLLQAMTNLLFVALAMLGKHLPLFAIAVVCDNFAAGMASTALVAFFMRLVNQRFTATQFSLLVAVATLPRVLSGPIAAILQLELGWTGLYLVSFLLAFAFIPFLRKISHDEKSALQS